MSKIANYIIEHNIYFDDYEPEIPDESIMDFVNDYIDYECHLPPPDYIEVDDDK